MTAKKDIAPKNTPAPKSKKGISGSGPKDLLGILDSAIAAKHKIWIWLFPSVALLFSLLLYDPKVSLSGDDSFYIIRASEFIRSFSWPSFQGPLYPMVLGMLVAVFGISLTPLKIFSLLSMVASIYITYKAFRDRIPGSLLFMAMMIFSINAFYLYYASQTYSEAFYILMQSLLLLTFFNYFIDTKGELKLSSDLKRHAVLAACLLAVALTRSIGYSAIVAVLGYFLLTGQWKNLLYSALMILGVFVLFQGIKYAIWHDGGLQFSNQGSSLLNKDYYNPLEGKEDMAGLMKRFTDNSYLYLSKHLMYMLGFRSFFLIMPTIPLISGLVYLMALTGLWFTYKSNRYLFFTGLTAGAFLIVTFFVLQAKWDQGRLIIPAYSLIVMLLLSSLYYLGKIRKLKFMQFVLPLLVVISFFGTLGATTTKVKEARKESGKYGGLTPDWKHYLQASEWAAKNLPEDAVIACRKPSISFVYGSGREFYGIMQMPSYPTEPLFSAWKKDPASYIAFTYSDFEGKNLTSELFIALKSNMLAQYITGNTFYFIEKLNENSRASLMTQLQALGVKGISSPDSLVAKTSGDKVKSTLVYPDSLLLPLVKNNVTHVITANLRRNSMEKNGQIINTVERYIAFIEDKYPGFMTKVNQIGTDDNEPAAVQKLDYGKTGFVPGKSGTGK
ncbi:MAG: hypothetical protein IPH88_16030 [Bacteroidales bacterium]|nr:hypothetical protein [Bacteroidales bacterium]